MLHISKPKPLTHNRYGIENLLPIDVNTEVYKGGEFNNQATQFFEKSNIPKRSLIDYVDLRLQ